MPPSFHSRVRAMLYGVALGDALGAPVEKLSAAEIRERYGRVDNLTARWHKMDLPPEQRNGRVRGDGIITDDTLMTLALCSVYAQTGRHLDAWDMADGMVRQIAWEPRWVPELQREALLIDRLFYPEKWIFQRHQLSACDPRQGGIGNMVNCGAAMYITPIGVVNAANPKAAYDEAIAFASGHQESYGLEAAGVLAAAVAAAFVPDATIETIIETALALAKDGTRNAIADICDIARAMRGTAPDHRAVVERFHAAIAPYSPMGDDVNHSAAKAGRLTDAYQPSRLRAIEELPLALGFCLVNDGQFRPAIVDGINSGRDTDSIGVMAGAILGALHGEDVIEPDDLDRLNGANRLDLMAAADAFAKTAAGIIGRDRVSARERDAALTLLDLNSDGPN
ncbi:MAG: ADP-ribosylglycohydrolase family protein [Devosia sp.]|uniref:ADP-ribosylglycohydrolase family protein n=1 Tax=Devosia sp. TaxID=1871048 RepID=UPI0024C65B85|nr:ADP-ribosylglycohydrolase family protein [Devosia sp.]UYO00522.1 MAG: ADP-ribosylglycohydrolase family protein [Devosia sp.]